MHWHRRLNPGVHPLLCAMAVALFLGLGAPPIFRGLAGSSIQLAGPYHSTDNFLRFATGINNGSQRLLAFFDSLSPSKKILIVVQGDDQKSAFLGSLVAYLAWPRPVRLIDLRKGDGPASTESDEIAAVAFCRVQPPVSWRGGERFGDSLEIFQVRRKQ
jgi:hypothetical protein